MYGYSLKLFEKMENVQDVYNSLIEQIMDTNKCIKLKSLSNFAYLTKQDQMHEQCGKWWYIMLTIPHILHWYGGIKNIVSLIRLLLQILQCKNEETSLQIQIRARTLFKKLAAVDAYRQRRNANYTAITNSNCNCFASSPKMV
jgi:hypothetical protein